MGEGFRVNLAFTYYDYRMEGSRTGYGYYYNLIEGVPFGAFIVPGLIMLSILTESISNASFGIYMPRFSGTIYEVLSAPISPVEIVIGSL